LIPEHEDTNPTWPQLREQGFPDTFSDMEPLPRRFLSFRGGAIKLLEYGGDAEAYFAFQRCSGPEELNQGFASRRNHALFRKGRWMGLWMGSGEKGELQAKFQLPEKENWGELPKVFASLLQQGRIPFSERVLRGRFLGLAVSAPIFAAAFDCRGDSAWLYASPEMTVDFASALNKRDYALKSEGSEKIILSNRGWQRPLRMDFFEGGMVGIEGCFDDSLTIHWVQTQKKVLKSLKFGQY
jgi:hypothetical protein